MQSNTHTLACLSSYFNLGFLRASTEIGERPFRIAAFLQRVINGGGQIVREMALGSGRLDLGVHFRGAVYAVEVKTAALYAKSHEKAHGQILRYKNRLGVSEGWLVVADSDLTKPWDCKVSTTDISKAGKTIHLACC